VKVFRFTLVVFLSWLALNSFSQKKDTTIILLSDMQIQIEATQALNDMYNFKFVESTRQYNWLKQKYKWHPLPYFLLGLNEWWKIMPNPGDKQYDETFLAYMDTVIRISEVLYKKPEFKVEASFFLSAAHGFKGRLYSDEDRKQWSKATFAGKAALSYLDDSKGHHNLSPELLFGDALYNYFSVWIPENYSILKPVMLMFPKGDKELGLKQLKEVSFNAFYTRTEAMVWLMRIRHSYENDPKGAFYIGEYLHKTYPDNAYFHRYYARLLYTSGKFSQVVDVCEEILARIDSGMTGYEATSGRYAAFYLGHINFMRKNYDVAKENFHRAVLFAESIGATETGYYQYSLLNLAKIYEDGGDKDLARAYYKKVIKNSSRGDSVNKQAKKRLKEM